MPQRRRVLITNFHSGTGGGHRTYILSLIKSSLAEEFEFAVACPASSSINSQSRQSGVQVFDFSFPGSFKELGGIVSAVWKLDRVYRQFSFEIIHCNGSRDHWIAIYWKTLFRRKVRILRTRHAVKSVSADFVHDWAFNRATALNIYVSRLMVPLAEPSGKLKLRNARVISNGVDTDYFEPRATDRKLAAELGLRETDFVLGSNAGLGSHKRVDHLLQAVTMLPDRASVKVLLLGEKRAGDLYLQMAQQMGIEGTVVYGGMHDDVRPFLSLFQLGFILSDSIETSSFAAKEMMAMGIPLLCTRYSGLPENVDEGQNGFLVAPGNLSELQKALAYFRTLSEAERNKLGLHSREKVVREFSRRDQIQALGRVYGEALSD